MPTFIEAVEQIRSNLDIVDTVSSHVVLKKKGTNYIGLCPFHNDKSPSMSVNRQKGIFKCFSCGAGGDALSFYIKINNLEFKDGIYELAEKLNIQIERSYSMSPEKAQEQKTLKVVVLEINNKIKEHYRSNLSSPDGTVAREYIIKRSLSDEIVKRFELGYSFNKMDGVYNYLKNQGYHIDSMTASGLIGSSETGDRHYDRFRGRLIFPILNDKGETAGFGGRIIIPDDKAAKYINSPDTPVYNKSEILYGLYYAKDNIKKNKKVIVCEGYMDCITMHQYGIDYAVAVLGTALTRQHIRLLSRYVGDGDIYLNFDNDSAGIAATIRSINELLPLELHAKVVQLEGAKDSDEYLDKYGKDGFEEILSKAVPMDDFLVDYHIKKIKSNPADTGAIIEATATLDKIINPIIKSKLTRKLAHGIGVSEDKLFIKKDNKKAVQKSPTMVITAQEINKHQVELERLFLAIALNKPELLVPKLTDKLPYLVDIQLSVQAHTDMWKILLEKIALDTDLESLKQDIARLLLDSDNFDAVNLLTELTPEVIKDINLDECVYKMLLYMVLQKKDKMIASADNLTELSKIQKIIATLRTFVYKSKG
jgi:DNA primase